MTIGEAYFSFLSKTGLLDTPELAPETYRIEYFFNEAIKLLINQMLPIADSTDEGRNFFKYLVTPDTINILSSEKFPNSVGVDNSLFNSDYLKILHEDCTLAIEDITITGIPVKPIRYDEYNINKLNPFKSPFIDLTVNEGLVWRLMYDNKCILITPPNCNITEYNIVYIKPHKHFSLSVLNDSIDIGELFHERLVDVAIEIAFGKVIKKEPEKQEQQESKSEEKGT